MSSFLKTGIGALVVGASLVAAVAPAEAQWRGRGGYGNGYGYGYGGGYRGYRGYRRGNDAGVAIGAGVLGLALGAAIASNNNRGYYDRGYYGGGGGYYDDGYYGRPYNRGYRGRDCYTRRVWDPYIQRRVKIRYCD